MRNLKVIARNSVDGLYYPGFVTETSEEPRIHVTFFQIQSQEVQREHIITIGGAVPWPELKVGDHALVGIRCKSMEKEVFVPAVVLILPRNHRLETKFFTVRLYTGQCVTKPRILIVKIGPEKYWEILSYIKTIRYGKQIRFPSDPNLHDSSLRILPNRGRIQSASKVKYRNRTDITTIKRLTVTNNELLKEIQRMKRRPKISRHTSTTSLDRSNTPETIKPAEKPKPNRNITPTDGQEVLARWPDDGWYYFGVVVTEVEHETYVVRDNTGNVDTILREDILIESEHSFEVIQPQDRVIALHPRYIFSYAPAVVKAVYNFGVQVEFFDTFTAKLPTSEVFKISTATYRKNIEYIKECEDNICSKGGNVVTRDDNSGYYIQCKAECRVGKDQQFFISLPQGKYVKQAAIHIFEITMSSGQHRRDKDWHYVLAPVDDYSLKYLPAQIVGRQPFSFSFCDGRQTKADTLKRCFYLSEDYYRLAVNYFINCQSGG